MINQESEGLRLMKAVIKNFKNIEYREINLGGRSIIIAGKNGKGKSSLIQALMSPVNAKYIPGKAIKEGQDAGSIELEVAGTLNGEHQKYNIDVYFSQQHQSGRLALTDKNGSPIKKSVATIIKSLVGEIGFDIFQFINQGKTATGAVSKSGVREQIETLKTLLPAELKEAIYKKELEKETLYKERATNSSTLDVLEAEYKGCPYDEATLTKYVEARPWSESELATAKGELQNITDSIETWNKRNSGVNTRKAERDKILTAPTEEAETFLALFENLVAQKWQSAMMSNILENNILSFRNDVAEKILVQKQKNENVKLLDSEISKVEAWLMKNEKPTIEGMSKKLEDMVEHNRICKDVKSYSDKHVRILDLKQTILDQTAKYNKLEEERKALFSSGSMPIKGLSFTDEEIYFNNLPFNEENQPKSTIIAVGVKIAMLLNPNLKVLIIQDGSLLDDETLNMVLKMSDKFNYQLLIERVDNEHDVPEITFTETEIN